MSTKLIQLIHIGRTQLGLDEDTYRDLLERVTGQRSCSKLREPQLQAVLDELRAKGFQPTTRKTYGQRPHNAEVTHRAELLKIEALLTDADKPWAYAEGLLKHMTKGRKQRLAFASVGELVAIIAALHRAACKRLTGELAATFGMAWEETASRIAALVFDKPPTYTLSSYPETMSQVLRWQRGELAVACTWPLREDSHQGCSGCLQRHLPQGGRRP